MHHSIPTALLPPLLLRAGTVHFVDTACANLDSLLPQEVIGQELALSQLADAVCHHLSQPHPKKPLVISVHGPPGVGKTYSHHWLARILYSKAPSAALQCPGMHCRGYKVGAALTLAVRYNLVAEWCRLRTVVTVSCCSLTSLTSCSCFIPVTWGATTVAPALPCQAVYGLDYLCASNQQPAAEGIMLLLTCRAGGVWAGLPAV